jgi:hypothetical protein
MLEPEGNSILIRFSESGEPEFFFNAATDRQAAILKEWVESNLCGRPVGLSGEGAPITGPGPASLSGRDPQIEQSS